MNTKTNTNLETIEPSNQNAEIVALAASMMLGANAAEKADLTDLELERRRGVEVLQEIGLLIPIDTLDLYHGRVDTKEGHSTWNIVPDYETDNFNAHRVPAVYASPKKEDAQDFAYQRGVDRVYVRQFDLLAEDISTEQPGIVRERMYKREINRWNENPVSRSLMHNFKTGEEVLKETPIPKPKRSDFGEGQLSEDELRHEAHRRLDEFDDEEKGKIWKRAASDLYTFVEKVIAKDQLSSIIDIDFFRSNKMSEEHNQRMAAALKQMLHEVTPKDALSNEERSILVQAGVSIDDYVRDRAMKPTDEKVRVSEQEINDLSDSSGIPRGLLMSYAAVFNAKRLILEAPARAVGLFLGSVNPIMSESYDERDVPIATFYIERFCKNNKIIGAKVNLCSTTIDRDVETISLFDVEAITATKLPKS